jgi:hypothetical protein
MNVKKLLSNRKKSMKTRKRSKSIPVISRVELNTSDDHSERVIGWVIIALIIVVGIILAAIGVCNG